MVWNDYQIMSSSAYETMSCITCLVTCRKSAVETLIEKSLVGTINPNGCHLASQSLSATILSYGKKDIVITGLECIVHDCLIAGYDDCFLLNPFLPTCCSACKQKISSVA